MSGNIEGRFTLDGMIEGRVADDAAIRLDEWVRLMAKLGLSLDLRLDGNRFSLLADAVEVDVATLGGDASAQIKQALEQLVAAIGPVEQNEIFSTLRSIEIQPGTEIQSVYFVRNDDTVDVNQERLVAQTTPPPKPLTRKDQLKLAGISLLVLAALYGVTSLFIPYGDLFRSTWNQVSPLDADEIEVDVSEFSEWFTVTDKQVGPRGLSIDLTLERSTEITGNDRTPSMYVLAMQTGYLRVEIFDAKGAFVSVAPIRVKGLANTKTLVVRVPVRKDPRPTRLVIVP